MFKKTFLTVAFVASAFVLTGCGKTEAPQPAENEKPVAETPAVEQKAPAASIQKGLDEYNDVVAYLKDSVAKKGEYPQNLDELKIANKSIPSYTYMKFGAKDIIFMVEDGAKTAAYFCSNKEMENCNPEAKKDGVTYSAYKDWVIATKK